MTGTGQHPMPLEQKRLLGNPGKRPLPDPRTTLPVAQIPPRPPRGLGLGKNGRAMWAEVAQIRWVGVTDVAEVVNVCRLADLIADLDADVKANGPSYEFRGRRLGNPSVGKLLEARKLLSAMLGAFGMTPGDRTRLGIAEVKAASRFDALMEQRGRRDG